MTSHSVSQLDAAPAGFYGENMNTRAQSIMPLGMMMRASARMLRDGKVCVVRRCSCPSL